ncbi:MAG: hypothetical protein IH885_04460 [Myxococcales bacterium]|nr:hypothetical protein [Myxococcales bacterium]
MSGSEEELEPAVEVKLACIGCGAEFVVPGFLDGDGGRHPVEQRSYCDDCHGKRGPAGRPTISRAQVVKLEQLEAEASGQQAPEPMEPTAGLLGYCDKCGAGHSPASIELLADLEPPTLAGPAACVNEPWCKGKVVWAEGLEATRKKYLERIHPAPPEPELELELEAETEQSGSTDSAEPSPK